MIHQWSRRRWLKTTAAGMATSLLHPLLNQVHAQDIGQAPRRFVFIMAGNGIESHMLAPDGMATAIRETGGSIDGQRFNFHRGYVHSDPLQFNDIDLATAPALAQLAGQGDTLDLRSRTRVLFGLSSKIAGGGHGSGYGALSCTASRGGVPASESIDVRLSQAPAVDQNHPFRTLRLGVAPDMGQRLQYGACAFGPRRPAPIIVDPSVGFSTLFGSVAGGSARQAFTDRSSLLDFARNDVRRALTSFSGSSRERAKLETYLDSVETLIRRQQRLVDAEESLRAVVPDSDASLSRMTSTHPLERLEAQFELLTAALLGGLTSTAVVTCGVGEFGLRYSSLESIFRQDPNYRGIVDRHTVCHEAAGNPAYQEVLDAVTTRQVDLIAQLARRLASVHEGNGTMLDHTVLVFMSDNGDQHHSPASEWPMMLMGGEALGLRPEPRLVVYPGEGQPNHRQVSNVFNTLGWCAGVELNTFGGEGRTRVAPGPLPEIFG